MLRTNVLVIGGGPAGATAARFLAGAGIDTILVERDFSYIKPCGGGIPSGGFHELALPESIIGKKAGKIVIISPNGRKIEISLNSGHIYITERGMLDSTLRKMAADNGAYLIEGQFFGFEKRGETSVSLIKKRVGGETIKIRSDYIIASDGISFSIGSSCGLKRHQHLYTISVKKYPFEGDACEFWFGTGHASRFYSWVFPSDGCASIGTGSTDPRELRVLLDNFLIRRFSARLDHLLANNVLGQPRIFPVPAWKGSPFALGNILFLGDAAGTVMPVTYEGIYYAMKSGQFAATAIIEKRPDIYCKLWEDRFKKRFFAMNKFKDHFFKSNEAIEKWIGIHRSQAVQELAMGLWLRKESGAHNLSAYLKAFGSLFKS